MMLLVSLLLLHTFTDISCEDLKPINNEEHSLAGSTVSLSYEYQKLSSSNEFYWYRQYPEKPPQFLISHSASGSVFKNPVPGLKIKVMQKQIHLEISSAAVTDSAVYYCAVRPTRGQDKIIFGRGARLFVQTGTKSDPSYYKVGNGNDTACLATGFTSHDATKEHPTYGALFNETAPVRPAGSSLYSQVFFPMGDDDKCEVQTVQGVSEDTLESDATVKLAAVITLGLRVIFIKTVVFNVLMTLRLWISQ